MTEPPVVVATTPNSAAPAAPPAAQPPAAPPATPPAAAPPAGAPPQGQEGTTPPPTQTPPDAKAPEGAPETYNIQIPEGMVMNQAALDKFLPLAKGANLTQETAQQLVDLFTEQVAGFEQGAREAWTKQQEEWTEAVKKDPEMGGGNYDSTLQHAQAFVARFGSPELQAFLDEAGIGSHPALVRAFAKAGKAAAEDTFGRVDPPGAPRSTASKFYPDMNP